MLFTYCNVGGNCGAYAWCGDGYDATGVQASARWRSDGCVTLEPDGLRIKTTGDPESRPPFFLLLPAETDKSTIIFEARLKCIENETGDACIINIIEAGELRFYPDRVDLVHDLIPKKPGRDFCWGRDIRVAESFKMDATELHTYRIVRTPDRTLTVKCRQCAETQDKEAHGDKAGTIRSWNARPQLLWDLTAHSRTNTPAEPRSAAGDKGRELLAIR